MKAIHIANEKKRDAEVAVEQYIARSGVKSVLPDGSEKVNVRILKHTTDYEFEALLDRYDGSMSKLEDAIINKDSDVDIEATGKLLRKTQKLYVNQDNSIAYRLNLYQVIYNAAGEEVERHDINRLPANINIEIPISWTAKRFPVAEAIRKFIFTRKYQLRHINGVTFDFLYNMAKELQDAKELVLVGAGKKGTEPILLTRGGQPYRGFLEGRAEADRYALILHLSDIELKPLSL